MTMQRVMNQTTQLYGTAAGNGAFKGKQTAGAFDLVIDHTMKGPKAADQTADAGRKASAAEKPEARQTEDATQNSSKADTQTEVRTKKQIESGRKSESSRNEAAAGQVKEDMPEEITGDAATLEKISAMLNMVRDTVKELLGLSDAELDQLMEVQGMELTDLLQPQNLQQLVLAKNGENDLLAVLTDEMLADAMNQLVQAVETVKEASGLELTQEQIKSLLEGALPQMEEKEAVHGEDAAESGRKVPAQARKEEAEKTVNPDKKEVASELASQKNNGSNGITSAETSKTEESSFRESSQRSSGEQKEEAADQFEAFLNNLSKASSTTRTEVQGGEIHQVQIREIADQIIQRIRVTVSPDQSSMELQLNPEHLGKVNLSVQSRNGIMTAQFIVQNEISREAVESQLHLLRDALNQQGLKVEAIEVSIAANSFEQSREGEFNGQKETKSDRRSNRISMDDAVNMTEEEDETVFERDVTGVRGSRIDYTA